MYVNYMLIIPFCYEITHRQTNAHNVLPFFMFGNTDIRYLAVEARLSSVKLAFEGLMVSMRSLFQIAVCFAKTFGGPEKWRGGARKGLR